MLTIIESQWTYLTQEMELIPETNRDKLTSLWSPLSTRFLNSINTFKLWLSSMNQFGRSDREWHEMNIVFIQACGTLEPELNQFKIKLTKVYFTK